MADLLEEAHGAVDRFVTGIGNALGVDFDGEHRDTDDTDDIDIRVRATPRASMLPPALPAAAQLALPAPTLPTPAAFEIIERDGKFFVTNGAIGNACPTREYAEQVRAALVAAVSKPAVVERLGGGGRR